MNANERYQRRAELIDEAVVNARENRSTRSQTQSLIVIAECLNEMTRPRSM